jgi:hypothetical protein
MSSKLAGLNQGFPLSPLKWRPMVPREITHLGRKPKQRLDVRKTVACTQADNSQVTTLFTHASHNSRCFQLWPRPPAFRERLAPDDTTKRRAKAHALPASTSPSLVFPQHQPAAAAAHAPPCSSACRPFATAPPIRQKAQWEHRRKCGGRTRQPRGPLTRCL